MDFTQADIVRFSVHIRASTLRVGFVKLEKGNFTWRIRNSMQFDPQVMPQVASSKCRQMAVSSATWGRDLSIAVPVAVRSDPQVALTNPNLFRTLVLNLKFD
ncbi:hypothetical protein ACOSP7_019913 [Xanthoceras sorbifolium]